MHSIQFNECLRKRKRDDENNAAWMRYAQHKPKEFVTALGYPNARVKLNSDGEVSVVDGVKVVAYCGTLFGPDPVFVTKRGNLVPIQLFKDCAPPALCVPAFGDDEANVANDVVPIILAMLNVRDACALGMVCRDWHSIVRDNHKYWTREAAVLGGPRLTTNARAFCLKMTLHGYQPQHSARLRKMMRNNTESRLISWILSSFLRRQVHRVEIRDANDYKETRVYGFRDSFVLLATTRDFVAMFVFTQQSRVMWKISGTHTWNVTSDALLVETYHNCIK